MEINIAATILQQHSSSQDVLLVYVVDLIVFSVVVKGARK